MYLFLKDYFTAEGAVPHNVLYYQQLSIARYQNYEAFLLKSVLSITKYM